MIIDKKDSGRKKYQEKIYESKKCSIVVESLYLIKLMEFVQNDNKKRQEKIIKKIGLYLPEKINSKIY